MAGSTPKQRSLQDQRNWGISTSWPSIYKMALNSNIITFSVEDTYLFFYFCGKDFQGAFRVEML